MDHPELTEGGLASQDAEPPKPNVLFSGVSVEVIGARMKDVPAPPYLYHYTSAQGLIGILEKHTVWFSNSMFLNDGSESTWGINIFEEVLDQYLEDRRDEEKAVGHKLKTWVREAFNFYQPIVFCMSSEDNLLNQWRDYGKDVTPYSIQFATEDLLKHNLFNFPTYLCEVIYDIGVQRFMTRLLIDILHAKYIEASLRKPFNPEDEEPLLIGAAQEIVWLLSRFKNTAFEAEKEWRLICHRPDLIGRVKTLFRSSSLGVVPYYEWFIPADGESRANLPVTHLTVGPSPYAAVSDIALKQFLAERGYGEVPTHFSMIPIRRA